MGFVAAFDKEIFYNPASKTLLRYSLGRIDCLRNGDAGKEASPHPRFR